MPNQLVCRKPTFLIEYTNQNKFEKSLNIFLRKSLITTEMFKAILRR